MTGQSVKKAFDKFWFHLAGTQLMFPNQRSGPSAGAQEIGFKSPGFSQGYSQFDAFSVSHFFEFFFVAMREKKRRIS